MTLSQRLDAAIREVPDFPKPGIRFKDISPILLDPVLVRDCARQLAQAFAGAGVNKVVGIESRGFLLGPLLAQELNAGFVIVRKQGKLPGATHARTYDLEYGTATIEVQQGALLPHDRVLVHDDLLATGGTALAAAQLVQEVGAQMAGFCFLVDLAFLPGHQRLHGLGLPIQAAVRYS